MLAGLNSVLRAQAAWEAKWQKHGYKLDTTVYDVLQKDAIRNWKNCIGEESLPFFDSTEHGLLAYSYKIERVTGADSESKDFVKISLPDAGNRIAAVSNPSAEEEQKIEFFWVSNSGRRVLELSGPADTSSWSSGTMNAEYLNRFSDNIYMTFRLHGSQVTCTTQNGKPALRTIQQVAGRRLQLHEIKQEWKNCADHFYKAPVRGGAYRPKLVVPTANIEAMQIELRHHKFSGKSVSKKYKELGIFKMSGRTHRSVRWYTVSSSPEQVWGFDGNPLNLDMRKKDVEIFLGERRVRLAFSDGAGHHLTCMKSDGKWALRNVRE